MTNREFVKRLEDTYKQCLEIVNQKNQDYATEVDPFKNFRFAGLVGMKVEDAILIRISDKLARISNLVRSGKKCAVKDESISDTLMDLANYAAILKTYLEWDSDDGVVKKK